jgi:hypothetical protein
MKNVQVTARELRIVEIATGRVVKRIDITDVRGSRLYHLECQLRQEIDEEAYRLEDTGNPGPVVRTDRLPY